MSLSKMVLTTVLLYLISVVPSLATYDMPASFYQAMSNMKTQDVLCIKNYDAGASFTESYTDFEHLDKETQVVSRSYNTSNKGKDYTGGNASLEAHIYSNVIRKAHIAWQSKDIMPDYMGRHAKYSDATEDLTGVFSLERFIKLWSNSTSGSTSPEWMPCS